MDHEEFKAIFSGIIAVLVALITIVGLQLKQRREVREIHHQTNNNSGASMKDHVDRSYQINQVLDRKFDNFAREMIPVMLSFRDSTLEHNSKVDDKLEHIIKTIKFHHGELK